MTDATQDLGSAVRIRLLRLARARGEDFQLVLTRYANERLLYRLAISRHGARFVLKGAALFTLWGGAPHRATRDVDLLGFGEPGEASLRATFAEILALDVKDDGVTFEEDSLRVSPIREAQEYGGVRVVLVARITTAKVRLQVDVGFGDAITPEAVVAEFPSLLGFPAPKLRAYPRETVVAEKLEAMVRLGLVNSRMKDFYDLAYLCEAFEFEGEVLVRAIRATFQRRATPLPVGLPVALTPAFVADPSKETQWRAFVRKSVVSSPGSLMATVDNILAFVEAPLQAAAAAERFTARWAPGGPWT